MARKPLTDRAIVNLRVDKKPSKHFDGGGLYIHVSTAGGKLWRQTYRFRRKTKLLCHGAYPIVSLKEARELRDAAKALIIKGIDPGEEKKARKLLDATNAENTFEAIARDWHATWQTHWIPKRAKAIMAALEADIFPVIGKNPIASITPQELLTIMKTAEKRGFLSKARILRQYCSQIFSYAKQIGKTTYDITDGLNDALAPYVVRHHASITDPRKVGELLRAIDGYKGNFTVSCALRLLPLVFTRPSELRCAVWSEFDFEQDTWRIPAERMKMRKPHIVPLARQVLEILRQLRAVTGAGVYLFPSSRSADQPISDKTLSLALKSLGYAGEVMTCHGFRSMASTLLNELEWKGDIIELQLAHSERNGVRAAYNHSKHLTERRKMMQAWADYLDELKQRRD